MLFSKIEKNFMSDKCLVYVDRLKKDGDTVTINEEYSAEVLNIQENNLTFPEKISIEVEAYLSEDHLVMNINAKALSRSPCVVCNEWVDRPIVINNLYHTEELAEIPRVFDCLPIIRESILLEIKDFLECNEGSCPERTSISSYLKQTNKNIPQEQVNYPFSNLK